MLHERVHLFTCHFVLSFYWLVVGLCWKPRILEAYTNAWQDILPQVIGGWVYNQVSLLYSPSTKAEPQNQICLAYWMDSTVSPFCFT